MTISRSFFDIEYIDWIFFFNIRKNFILSILMQVYCRNFKPHKRNSKIKINKIFAMVIYFLTLNLYI